MAPSHEVYDLSWYAPTMAKEYQVRLLCPNCRNISTIPASGDHPCPQCEHRLTYSPGTARWDSLAVMRQGENLQGEALTRALRTFQGQADPADPADPNVIIADENGIVLANPGEIDWTDFPEEPSKVKG